MKKLIYRRCAIFAGVVVCAVIYAFVARAGYLPSNMKKYTSVEQLIGTDVRVGDMVYDSNLMGCEEIGRTAEQQMQLYFDAFDSFECCFIVRGTGNIEFSYFATFQEMEIIEVIRGEGTAGEKTKCIFQAGRLETRENGVFLMTYGVNLMQKDKEYLLFCDTCDLTNYSKEAYYLSENGICYFALDNDNVAMVNDNYQQYTGDYATCEFYMQSEQGVETVKVFKERVMERYLPDGYR